MKVRGVKGSAAIHRGATLLNPGQLVRGRVLAKAGDGHFLVAIRGFLLDAASDLPLEAGQRLTARVEVDGDRLRLRLQEDGGGHGAAEPGLENPQDIERILRRLGHHPTSLDVREFQERLDRYHPYASLPGVEPSDIWILAVLWTRGVRSGADSFALLSYYLRAWARQPSPEHFRFPQFDDALPFLENDLLAATSPHEEISADDSLIPGIENRRAEAIRLLNREEIALGRYGEIAGLKGIHCGLLKGFAGQEQRLIRLADHPVWPTYVIELDCRGLQVSLQAYLFAGETGAAGEGLTALQKSWLNQAESSEFKLENANWEETADIEVLRSAFWRLWESPPLCDREA